MFVGIDTVEGVVWVGVADSEVEVTSRPRDAVLGVHVLIHDMIAKVGHFLEASRSSVAFQVGCAHVGRDPAKEVTEGHFVVDYLRSSDGAVDLVEIAMGPGVAGNVMVCSVHASHHSRPWVGRVINVTLAPVVTSHKEGCLDISFVQEIQKIVGVVKRAIVECESNHTGCCASGDDASCNKITTLRTLPQPRMSQWQEVIGYEDRSSQDGPRMKQQGGKGNGSAGLHVEQ
ncbi:hypothetical protein HG530_003778 [Fusarium avenaceum]|nr:hypothetical protein HG530_003778 [Fusarium avenaceum]